MSRETNLNSTYALRLFLDGKRIKSHALTKVQAQCFRIATRTLDAYLTKEYKLNDGKRKGKKKIPRSPARAL